MFGPDQLALKIVEQADVLRAGTHQVVDVVVEKEVTGFARVVLARHARRPRGELIDLVC